VTGAPLLDLLFDLIPGQERLLFHVLVCSPCRERASVVLLERHGTRLALPAGGLLGEDCDPEFPVEGLLDELLAHPREHHFELLDEPPFQEALLVQPLLTRSRQEQLRDPDLAEHLAFLAVRLAGSTLQRKPTRSGVLADNARRLTGRLMQSSRPRPLPCAGGEP
jgi:hypothetical protein